MRYIFDGLLGLCAASELVTGQCEFKLSARHSEIKTNIQYGIDKLQNSHPRKKKYIVSLHKGSCERSVLNPLDASILSKELHSSPL